MDEIDKKIIKLLGIGLSQSDISSHLKKKGVTPNSVSIIEKRLRKIKKLYKAKTLFHLAVILKRKRIT